MYGFIMSTTKKKNFFFLVFFFTAIPETINNQVLSQCQRECFFFHFQTAICVFGNSGQPANKKILLFSTRLIFCENKNDLYSMVSIEKYWESWMDLRLQQNWDSVNWLFFGAQSQDRIFIWNKKKQKTANVTNKQTIRLEINSLLIYKYLILVNFIQPHDIQNRKNCSNLLFRFQFDKM